MVSAPGKKSSDTSSDPLLNMGTRISARTFVFSCRGEEVGDFRGFGIGFSPSREVVEESAVSGSLLEEIPTGSL